VNQDLKTVIWKERKMLFSQRGGRKQVILTLLVPVAIFAILFPWQEGSGFFESPLAIIASIFIPVLVVMLIIPESFAGERERHTLETLLASRLTDIDILFGKMIVSIGMALAMFLIAFITAGIVANITDWTGQLMFYTPIIALASIILSILFAVLSAAAGVLISLRSPTVREAQQTLMAIIMFPGLLLGVAGTFLLTMEGFREYITSTMENVDPYILILAVAMLLGIACYVLLKLAIRRFQREKLIISL
jgi:ABC-2 type transport system permease protein